MSMVNPSIDKLAEMVDSKYTLAILAAKRARELTKPGQTLPEKEQSAVCCVRSCRNCPIRSLSQPGSPGKGK